MSDSTAPAEECPSCGVTTMTFWEDLETWVCDDCSYVIGAEVAGISTQDLSANIIENGINNDNWEQSISVKDKSEQNLVEVLGRVEKVIEELEVAKEMEIRAAEIVVEAWEINFMHGRTMPDTVGGSVYAASRELQHGIPPAIIAKQNSTDQESVKQTYQRLKKELQLDIAPPTSAEYLHHICRELNLPSEVETTAEMVLDGYYTGGNPVGIAAAAIYIVSKDQGNKVSLREISEIIGLTKETIWRQVSKIREMTAETGSG